MIGTILGYFEEEWLREIAFYIQVNLAKGAEILKS